MKKLHTIIFFLFSISTAFSQDDNCVFKIDSATKEKIYVNVDQSPYYGTSDSGLFQYLKDNFDPPNYLRNETIIISFVILENGEMTNIELLKNSNSPLLNEYTKGFFQNMNNWSPGKCKGEIVKVEIRLPIKIE
jgi:hypothetical protein